MVERKIVGAVRSGFTLIEAVAVMLVVGVMAAVAIPSLSTVGSQQAATAAQILGREMLFARARAMSTGTVSWVVFDVTGNAYSVLAENPASLGRSGATTLTDPTGRGLMVRTLGRNDLAGASLVSATFAGQSEVGFDRLGRPLKSDGTLHTSSGVVTLTGGWTVTVTATTGDVRAVGP